MYALKGFVICASVFEFVIERVKFIPRKRSGGVLPGSLKRMVFKIFMILEEGNRLLSNLRSSMFYEHLWVYSYFAIPGAGSKQNSLLTVFKVQYSQNAR